MNVHYFQHVPFEGLASIQEWSARHFLSATQFYAGNTPPAVELVDFLILLGGPMNIYEEKHYPWLKDEKHFIEQALKQDKRVLGICLGAQILADVLGAKVFQNRYKEIGWFPIQFTEDAQTSPLLGFLPQRMPVFHWHGDTFDLPLGATRLATSEGCDNQAFGYGETVLALQFHLETTNTSLQMMLKYGMDEIAGVVDSRYVQQPDDMLACSAHFDENNRAMVGILDRFTENVQR